MVRLVQMSVVLTCSALLLLTGNSLAQPSGMPAQATASPAQATASPATTGTAAKSGLHHSAKRKAKEPEQPVVQTPPRTLTPGEMAPVAPTVSYQAGQLTIESKNATLAQVLRSVQEKTGGAFDIPASANNDRVVAQLGPGQPKDILASLLNGSKFNYIILGVPNEPGAVQKLILTPRTNAPITAQNVAVRQPPPEPQEEDYSAPEPPPPEPTPVEDNTAVENQNQPPQEPYRPGFPGQQPQIGTNGEPQQGVKTPEQLLQELQRLQQQQQLYQQQLNPANRNLQQNYKPQEQE